MCVVCAHGHNHKHRRCVHTACVLLVLCVSCHIYSLMVPSIDRFSARSVPGDGERRSGINSTLVLWGNSYPLRSLERPKSCIFNKLLIMKNPELVLCRIQMSVLAICLGCYSRVLIVQIMLLIQSISDSDLFK